MRVSRRAFLGAAGLAVVAPSVLPRAALGSGRAEPFFVWERVRDGVWAAVGDGGNALAVLSGDGALLVDTKFPGLGKALRREAEAKTAPLALAINTHHHADHTGGNLAVVGDVPVLAHHAAPGRVRGQLDRYVQMARGGPAQVGRARGDAERVQAEAAALAQRAGLLTAEDFVPTRTIDRFPHEERFGELAVELHHFGAGHTDNDVVVRFPSLNVVHTGDLVFSGMHPFFDPPGGATCRGWIAALEGTLGLCDRHTLVTPGHGDLTDAEGVRAQKEYLERLWDEVSKAVREGRERAEVETMRWDFMEGLGYEQIRPRAVGAVYEEVRAAEG